MCIRDSIWVKGLQSYRPIGAMSFLGRYRVIDFPLSNMSNSGIDQIQVYINQKPRSLTEHIGTGRHYNINSKRGKVRILFSENGIENSIYDNEIAAYIENIECIENTPCPYVIIAPSYMVYSMDFDSLLQSHIDSGADITLLYHSVDNAKDHFLNCDLLNLNLSLIHIWIKQKRSCSTIREKIHPILIMHSISLTEPPTSKAIRGWRN